MTDYLETGGRLDIPALCPVQIYNIMQGCWNIDPMERPTFKQLKSRLDSFDPTTATVESKVPMKCFGATRLSNINKKKCCLIGILASVVALGLLGLVIGLTTTTTPATTTPATTTTTPAVDQCNPSPCGTNALCQPRTVAQENNSSFPLCKCSTGFTGNPYTNCFPQGNYTQIIC